MRERNGSRSDQFEELADEAILIQEKKKSLDPTDIDGKRSLRKESRSCDCRCYRLLLDPVDKAPLTDEWIMENIGSGFLEHEIMPIQAQLDNHQDVLGKN